MICNTLHVAVVNECLDARLNDCDTLALCEDNITSYTCTCPTASTIDQSPDPARPGRRCVPLVNECATKLNNCSRFADCTDKPIGYECKCKQGYFDNNSRQPGTACAFGTCASTECACAYIRCCSCERV
jgi:hypothetical protein